MRGKSGGKIFALAKKGERDGILGGLVLSGRTTPGKVERTRETNSEQL